MVAASPAAHGAELPIVVVPVGTDEDALDACLGALEQATPAGTRIWLADDARGGPRVRSVVEAWLATTRMQAEYGRRPRAIGESAHLAQVLETCRGMDVAVLAGDARPAPGWLPRMARCLADGSVATVTPWSNAGESAAWPRLGEVSPVPDDAARIARAAAELDDPPPPLPAAVDHAVLLRGEALRRVGGVDATSYASWYAALIDLCLRLEAFGGRHVLCPQAYVARPAEGGPAEGDLDRVAARWPRWNATIAGFLMTDPLAALRAKLAASLQRIEAGTAVQPALFPDADPAA